MPNMLQYIEDATGKPKNFDQIDAEICAYLGITYVDPERFVYNWYGAIGDLHALGKSRTEILEIFTPGELHTSNDAEMCAIAQSITNYIHAFYTPRAWYQAGRWS